MLITPSGVSGWAWDVRPGYPNWGYTQNTVTEHEKFTRAAITWLTGKTSGANILLYRTDAALPFGDEGFCDFVTRSDSDPVTIGGYGPWTASMGLSCTLTITNNNPVSGASWTLTNWRDGGAVDWNPTLYDLVILTTTPNALYHYDGIDDYLAYGGSVWGLESSSGTAWERYGIASGSTQTGGGAPDYMTPAFTCPLIGSDSYRYGIYTSPFIVATTNTMGGTSRCYPNGSGDDRVGTWRQYS